MDIVYNTVINLIKSGLYNEPVTVSDGVDFDRVYALCKEHGLIALAYYGIKASKLNINSDMLNKFENDIMMYVLNDTKVDVIFSELSEIFNDSKIDFMPIKGVVMREMYPNPEMRTMGDIDILIKESQFSDISELMNKYGYELMNESRHEYVYGKNTAVVELHKSLVPVYDEDYYSYFGTGWKRAVTNRNSRYSMSSEDEYIYLLAHMAKHYRNAGVNILHMVDIWVYLMNNKLDSDYLKKELENLGLYKFHCNVLKTLENWFKDGEETEMTEFITKRMFESGCWGTFENFHLSKALQEVEKKGGNAKAQRLLSYAFPPYDAMVTSYPILKGRRYLLPVVWLGRMLKAPFTKRDSIKQFGKGLKLSDSKSVESYRQELEYVGLDYDYNKKSL